MPIAAATTPATNDKREAPETRERILRTTFELVGQDGIGALSNRRIAAAAGVSLGSLTYHFPAQAVLLRESLNLYVTEEVARLEAITAELHSRRPAPSPRRLAAEIQRIAAESILRPQPLAELELYLQAARDPALQQASQRCFAAYEGLAAAAFEAMGIPEPGRYAHTVVAMVTGIGVQWLATGRRDTSDLTDAMGTIIRGALADSHAGEPAKPIIHDA